MSSHAGKPPQGPPRSQDRQGSSAEGSSADPPCDRVFAQFCKDTRTCVCIFSTIGLAWLKDRPDRAKVIAKAIGGALPERTPAGCKGSLKGGETGLLQHAENKKQRAPALGESSESEDDDESVQQKGHELFHAFLDRRISPGAKQAQKERMLAGQSKEHRAKIQKITAAADARVASAEQATREMAQRHQEEKGEWERERRAHEQAMADLRERGDATVRQLEEEFGNEVRDHRKQQWALELAEAEKRQLQLQLDMTRRGLEEQERRRKAEVQAQLQDWQATNRELEQERAREREAEIKAESKRRLDELTMKLQRKQEEVTRLSNEKDEILDDYDDTVKPLKLQNDRLMSRVDALYLVGVCATATEFHTDRALAEVSQETILKLNGPQAIKGTTAEADRSVKEAVRNYLQSRHVNDDHLKFIGLNLSLGLKKDDEIIRQELVDKIMEKLR